MTLPPPNGLAEQALENLVNQFARPLDFLRELVQNSIDAGSPRVEVSARYRRAEGVLELAVRDWGEGMDEAIIDGHLTRLFSSSKEDDLTRIGKFGIGFTSVFALQPEAVLVRTGRHGESWELLFHPDRSFDKVRGSEPIHGTQITLFKSLNQKDAETTIRDSRWTLRWWCEHTDTPVSFIELPDEETQGDEAPAEDDPFAAFAAPAPLAPKAETISRPLDIEAELSLHHETPVAEVVIGYASTPRYGFFNGGLTLVNSGSLQLLGRFADRLEHLRFKVKSRHLEHTLTRDNVIQDKSWERVMEVVCEAANRLRGRLAERCAQAAAAGEPMGPWHRHLLAELEALGGGRWLFSQRKVPLLRCWGDEVVCLDTLERQEALHGVVPFAVGPEALLDALHAEGVALVLPHPATHRLLERYEPFSLLKARRRLVEAPERWLSPRGVALHALPPALRRLIEEADAQLEAASGARLRLRPVRLGGGGALAVEGPEEDRVFARGRPSLLALPVALRRRTLLLDLEHPALRPLEAAAASQPLASAYALALACAESAGGAPSRVFKRLLAQSMEAAR